MEMLFVNERRAPRHAVPVESQVVREDGFTMLGERAIDLSTCGMLLLSESPATIGDEVMVSLRIPGKEQWIDARGKIARIAEGRAIAIAFNPLEPNLAHALEEALCAYPTVPPSRPPRVDYAATVAMISAV